VLLAGGVIRVGFASFGVNLVGNDAWKRGGLGMLGNRAISRSVLGGRKRHVELGFRHDYSYDISKSERVPFVSCESSCKLGTTWGYKGVIPFSKPV
jgi:hypothetical protein